MGIGYYDVEISQDMFNNSVIGASEILYLANLKQRKIFLEDVICKEVVDDLVMHIMQYNCEDKGLPVESRKPILLYINTNGGDVDYGFMLIDAIQSSITPVYTVNLGVEYSMGFLVGIAGHKRFATKNSKVLIHDGTNYIFNSGAKAQDEMSFNQQVEERIEQLIVSRTKISKKEYKKNLRTEWYMFANEAKEKGVFDFIIGEDCSIEEVV